MEVQLGDIVLHHPGCNHHVSNVGIVTEVGPKGVCKIVVLYDSGPKTYLSVFHKDDPRLMVNGVLGDGGKRWGCWEHRPIKQEQPLTSDTSAETKNRKK
jgi:hypothetical protein